MYPLFRLFRNKNVQRVLLWATPFLLNWLFGKLNAKNTRGRR